MSRYTAIVTRRSITTATLWQIGSQVVMAGLSVVMVKLVTIGLSKELVGSYNSAYGFLQLFGIVADFGLYAIAVRELSKAQNKPKVFGTLLAVRLCILCCSLGLALTLAWSIPAWRGTPLPLGITIAALVPFFTLLAGIIRTVFQVHFAMHYVFIAEVLQRIITTGAIAGFILYGVEGSTDVTIYYWFLLIGGIGALWLLLTSYWFGKTLMPLRIHLNAKAMREVFSQAAPYGIAFFCMALYRQSDITLIALMHTDYEVQNAYYGVVLRMVEMGYVVPTFLLNSTLPVLSENRTFGRSNALLLGKTLSALLIIGSISLVFSLFWSRPLVALLTTENYLSTAHEAGSDTALQLMSIPIFLNGIIVYGFYTLLSMHNWKHLVQTLALGAVVSIALNVTLIPTYGFIGAGITSIVVHILVASILLVVTNTLAPPLLARTFIARWLAFTVLLGGFLWLTSNALISELHTVFGLFFALLVIIGLLKVTGMHILLTQPSTLPIREQDLL
jgi:O-antigen/teichoic acid export membrane protein